MSKIKWTIPTKEVYQHIFKSKMHSKAIVENGGKVIIGDINLEATKKVCNAINTEYPGKAYPVYLNVLDKSSIQSVLDEYPDINVLINNAAIDPKVTDSSGPSGSFESLSLDEWNLSIDVMMKGTFLCSQVFCPYFESKGGGIVINISSDLGVIAPDQRIYEGSKK